MSQIKVYALREHLIKLREPLSDVVHSCIMDVLGLPKDKRAHRFFHLDRQDFYMPEGRTDAYTIFVVSMISGKNKETKRKLISTFTTVQLRAS